MKSTIPLLLILAATAAIAVACGKKEHAGVTVPPEIASTQSVTFHVHNASGTRRWICAHPQEQPWVTQFGIGAQTASGVEGIALAFGYQCGCECPQPPTQMAVFVAVSAGGNADVGWDARELNAVPVQTDCGPIGPSAATTLQGNLQPAPAGNYVFSIGVADSALALACSGSSTAGGFTCDTGMPVPMTIAGACLGSTSATATFALGSAAQTDVDVSL